MFAGTDLVGSDRDQDITGKLTWPSGSGPWSLGFLLVSVAKSLILKILYHMLLRDDCFGGYPQGVAGL